MLSVMSRDYDVTVTQPKTFLFFRFVDFIFLDKIIQSLGCLWIKTFDISSSDFFVVRGERKRFFLCCVLIDPRRESTIESSGESCDDFN